MRSSRTQPNKVSNYIFSIIANAAVLIVLNLLPNWDVPVLTETYPNVLWAINLSLLVQMAGCLLLIFLHPLFLHYLAQAVFAAFSLVAVGVILTVFPVDFARLPLEKGDWTWLNTIFRIALIVGIVGTAVSIIVNLIKAIRSLFPPED